MNDRAIKLNDNKFVRRNQPKVQMIISSKEE